MTGRDHSMAESGRATMTRRAALLGLAAVPVAGGAVCIAASPTFDELGDLIARHDAAEDRLAAAKAHVANLEALHPELVTNWPQVRFNGQWFSLASSIGWEARRIIANIEKLKERGFAKFAAKFRRDAAAKMRELRRLEREHTAALRDSGLSAAWDAVSDEGDARDMLFDAVIDYRPLTLADVQRRNTFLARACPKSEVTQHTMARALFEAIMVHDSSKAKFFANERRYA